MAVSADLAHVRWLSLGSILVGSGLVTQDELEQALEAQTHRGGRLGDVVAELGYTTTRQIAAALAEQCRLEYRDLNGVDVDPKAVRLLDERIARRYDALPIGFAEDGTLELAFADPTNLRAIDDVQLALGRRFRPVVAEETQLEHAIARAYRSRIELAVVEPAPEEERTNDIRDMASSTPTIQLVNRLLSDAIEEGASDLHFEPKRDRILVRSRVDGVMRDVAEVPKHMQPAVTSRLKVMGALDIAERRVPQDGRVSVHFGSDPIDVRIAVMPLRHGEQVVLRILTRRGEQPHLDDLGLDAESEGELVAALAQPFGAIVVCGPTGSGKTTTLYAALDRIGDSGRVVMTVEDPIEYELAGANQSEVDEKAGLTFARGLRTILRSDPDVLLVGEIRDAETAGIATQAAMTGHLVLTSLHAHTAAGAIARLREMGVPGGMIAGALNLVVAQRLARRLCEECKEPYAAPTGDEVEQGTPLWLAVGCGHCGGTGYRGRVPLFELLPIRGDVRGLVEDSADQIFAAAVRQGMRTLREDGLRLCRAGVSSLDEIRRVTGLRIT
jgi:type IV pilus assembly protein PilB